ncbi:hypothetical protein KSC_110070 [Ktedonobacter sp. SOSP1-52]|uniref:hypothetical protein n=1 Tax=Ktedonobacter sp. SOSP1-52 TaxID=2778366 RepID=UPI00191617A5|nr:hypothetical protein [Ktedonobacter sp. SOSP1-52]GHO72115.1 hypothetical protein KSC_110070 [Ktedonobacter sp. SOSP1-52]
MSETPAPQNAHFPVDTEHSPCANPSYRYLSLAGRMLDREHIVTLIDHRSRQLAPGIEVVFTHERLPSFLVQGNDEQETLLTWYLQALPQPPRPFLQFGAHLLARACICEVIESSIEGDTTLLLRYLSLPDPLMGNAESSIQTLELHGQSADAVRHWLSTQTEVIVPLQPVASRPSIALDNTQDTPCCPHCESWLTPLWNNNPEHTLTLVCLLCHYTDGPFTRGDMASDTTSSKKG